MIIYAVISNVILAIALVVACIKYSQIKKNRDGESESLNLRLKEVLREKESLQQKLDEAPAKEKENSEAFIKKIDELIKEREEEIKLRLNAEKQIELALQKTNEIQKRLKDWQMIQDAVLKDSKNAVSKVGEEIYQKMNESYKVEVENSKNLIGRVSKNISDFFQKFSEEKQKAISSVSAAAKADFEEKKNVSKQLYSNIAKPDSDEQSKKMILNIVDMLGVSGKELNKEYFLQTKFDKEKAKLFLCEVAFIVNDKLYIVDFKGCRYLAEYDYSKAKNKEKATNNLKQRLDKYFAYLGNAKYRTAIKKVVSSMSAKFKDVVVVMALPSKIELQVVKDIGYNENATKQGIEVMELNRIDDLIL